ncbi:MAG: hypothetical protein C5B48_15275 [Candidatus Rokuibacteriota bacterium]|nr:MAG: hypothetical protein C5B48_15275 [Candidatus Rokubacteria bacterium]
MRSCAVRSVLAMLFVAASAVVAVADEAEDESGSPPAAENLVIRNESLTCGTECDDSFEVKCTQASQFVTITVEDTGTLDDPLVVTCIATVPAAIYGQTDVDFVAAGGTRACSFVRPGAEGLIKGLVAVTGNGAVPAVTYQIRAECFSDAGGVLVSRNTVITRLQNN